MNNILLWIIQVLLAGFFAYSGVIHYTVPANLPPPMQWMYQLSKPVHYIAGTAEILASLGLILPMATGILAWLTPLAAIGLITVMLLAMLFHIRHGQYRSIRLNLILLALATFVAYGRFVLVQP